MRAPRAIAAAPVPLFSCVQLLEGTTVLGVQQTSIRVYVTATRPEGTLWLGYGTDEAGRPVLFAGDYRMMAAVAAELRDRNPVPVTVEPWQILGGGEAA